MSKHESLDPKSPLFLQPEKRVAQPEKQTEHSVDELQRMIAANSSSDPEFTQELRDLLEKKLGESST